jgi:hypothetical protein
MKYAQNLYESISDVAAIGQFVTDRVQEGIYLEFKTKKDNRTPELDESDAFQLSRALSGFANSDGGVIVWGVETDKEERARLLKPIPAIADFEARIKKSLLNSVQPMVDDVRIESFLDGGANASGYLKCLIPRSEKTPHRALRANREYYRRSTEGFYRLEHFDLEDAFGRRPRPVLSVHLDLLPRPGDDPHEEVRFAFLNEGRGPARHAAFTCAFDPGVQVAQAAGRISDNSSLNAGRPVVSHQEDVAVIHPVPIVSSVGAVVIKRPDKGSPLPITIRWYCEGMQNRVWKGDIVAGTPTRERGEPG